MNKIIAVTNQKGGVGKTTTAINLSACLAMKSRRTLLIDFDPQGMSTLGLAKPKEPGKGIYQALMNGVGLMDCIQGTEVENLYLCPCSPELAGVEAEIAEEVDRIVGLEVGADDYVPKPFSPRELVARVKAVLRRGTPPVGPSEAPVSIGNLRLDPGRHGVTKGDRPIELSAMEFRLLEFFLRHRGRVFTRTQLLDQVWGQDRFVEPRTVDVHIRRLREKVEDAPRQPTPILTVSGMGYKCRDENDQ